VLEEAFEHQAVPQFQDDKVTMHKLASLARNLGQPVNFADTHRFAGQAPFVPAVFALNAFGQLRDGHMMTRRIGIR
jgi:hypothetical protein